MGEGQGKGWWYDGYLAPREMVLTALLVAGLTPPAAAQTADEAAIRQARLASNAAIARHDIPGILAHLEPEYQATVSSGALITGPAAMGEAFAEIFGQFPDATYVRTAETVELSTMAPYAAETGTWVGTWTTPEGPHEVGGRYQAYWRKTDGVWRIHAELFVPLYCEGAGCG